MRFSVPHGHAFSGGRVIVDDDRTTGPECLVEFGDGMTVVAEWRRAGDAIDLGVPAYRTAKGTQIAARRWRLVQRKDGVWRLERANGDPALSMNVAEMTWPAALRPCCLILLRLIAMTGPPTDARAAPAPELTMVAMQTWPQTRS